MANPMPVAEVDVTADLVQRLLAGQHPDLAHLPVEFLANGWDNVMFRVGAELAARLPRRTLGAQILVHEQRWLPLLAPRLPLPIPYPERIGHPAHGYPWPWSIVPYLPGEIAATADRLDLPLAADAIAGFLGALHVPAPPDAPPNPFRGMPLADRAENFGKNLDILAGQVDRAAVLGVWEDALAAPVFAGPPLWLHGDMHPANILVRDGRVTGIIDFGDITAGDPAADLSVAWMLLPASLRGAFRDAYQAAAAVAADAALWRRARGWALNHAVACLANSADNPLINGIGDRTLRAVLG
jgi:aminoglycoside phosphotransferase (APT) family kinase protein